MNELGIPGAAMALIDHDHIVFEGGFGVREVGKDATVNPNTLFMIASDTKGLTTLLLAELVDEGRIRWEEPVINALPTFKLGDEELTKRVRFEDLVCACTGLPRQDLEWIFNGRLTTAADTFRLMATMHPTTEFGRVYQYSNVLAAAAGFIGGHLVYPGLDPGAAYDRAMYERVFRPLGMSTTTFDLSRALSSDHASPHGVTLTGTLAVGSIGPDASVVAIRPAGGAWSSVGDMARYLRNELTNGRLPDGHQLVSTHNLLRRWEPRVKTGSESFYGMGMVVTQVGAVTVISHPGGLPGFKSNFYLLPKWGIGAVLLTNADSGRQLLPLFEQRLLELLFDERPRAQRSVLLEAARTKASLAAQRSRLWAPADELLVAQLANHYVNPDLGSLTVSVDARGAKFSFDKWESHVASCRNEDGSVSFVTIDPTVSEYEFTAGQQGNRRVLTLRDAQHTYVFIER